MNLKTANRIAIEKAIQQPKGKGLILLGLLDNALPETPTFVELFKESDKFFYFADKMVDNVLIFRERGIGYIQIIDNKPVLIRSDPLAYYDNNTKQTISCANRPLDLHGDVVVTSSYPLSIIETLCSDYSVACCDDKYIPKNIGLCEYSFLGRLDQGIVSIPFSEFYDHDQIAEALTRAVTGYTKQITLSATKLNMKSKRGVISSNIFHLNPTSNPPAKKGTIIYDEASDNLKYYDGANWRTLKYELDQ